MYIKRQKIKIILKCLRGGKTIEESCKAAGISTFTLWNWRKHWEKLDKAVRNAIDGCIQIVEDSLFKAARDGNMTAIIFFLTNRYPEKWADKRAIINNKILNANMQKSDVQKNDVQLPEEDERLQDELLSKLEKFTLPK